MFQLHEEEIVSQGSQITHNKRMKPIVVIRFLFASVIATACMTMAGCYSPPSSPSSLVTGQGIRKLGIDILDPTPTNTFTQNIALAKATGASFMNLNFGWNQIEASTPNDCSTAGTLNSSIRVTLRTTQAASALDKRDVLDLRSPSRRTDLGFGFLSDWHSRGLARSRAFRCSRRLRSIRTFWDWT